jgi:hypothetical protein
MTYREGYALMNFVTECNALCGLNSHKPKLQNKENKQNAGLLPTESKTQMYAMFSVPIDIRPRMRFDERQPARPKTNDFKL